jgi:peroxiredoxin Q/BCP
MLNVGDQAPLFSRVLPGGKTVALADYRGRMNVVLFFYPEDFTAGCTREVCAYRDGYADIAALNAAVIGVSLDDDASHERFRERHGLPFVLIADNDRSLSRAYDVLWLGGFFPYAKRVTYVIDKAGIVRLAWHRELAITSHITQAAAMLRNLKRTPGSDEGTLTGL